jgi:peptidoglycan L-alanyl-D-glutamate endopeptidase CwlK
MPSDLFLPKLDLDLAYPPFLERLLKLQAWCRDQGFEYLCTFLFRSPEEQEALYQAHLKGGPLAAPGGLSAHNYGLAADVALIVQKSPKRVVRWDPHDFDKLAEGCDTFGLAWGGKFNDKDHVGLPGYENAAQLDPLRRIWESHPDLSVDQRLAQVWATLKGGSDAPP